MSCLEYSRLLAIRNIIAETWGDQLFARIVRGLRASLMSSSRMMLVFVTKHACLFRASARRAEGGERFVAISSAAAVVRHVCSFFFSVFSFLSFFLFPFCFQKEAARGFESFLKFHFFCPFFFFGSKSWFNSVEDCGTCKIWENRRFDRMSEIFFSLLEASFSREL